MVFAEEAIDLISGVKELQRLNSQELSKLLKESENFSLSYITENGLSLQIDLDKLVRLLPLHLTAVLLSCQRDEASFRYLLSGFRLLHSFCEIASRQPKLEQILLDNLKVSEQLLDLVFYLLAVCSACKQGNHISGAMPLLHSTLVSCSMYLLTACISSQWDELAYVLQVHPKIDIFIDAAFGAVRRNINFLQIELSCEDNNIYSKPSLAAVYFCCQQCEASLQFLQQLCQNKSFRERLLRNKELCGKGGVLRLVQATLKLKISCIFKDSVAVFAAASRLKARVLSILLYLCEAECISYLDEVASIPVSLDLAKIVVMEVIALLKTMVSGDLKLPENHSGKKYCMGILQLTALRLADIFSDDSNFRSYITVYFSEVLAVIVLIPYQQFLSSWCSSDSRMKEEDASLDYEPFTAAGWILDLVSPSDEMNSEIYESNFNPINSAQASYAHQRTSLLVKVIANLHCFVPEICKEQERNLFLHKFFERLKMVWEDPKAEFSFDSIPQKAATVFKNLRSLLGHAESLIPTFLNEEDVQLLRVFITQLESLIGPVGEGMEIDNAKGCSSPIHEDMVLDKKTGSFDLTEGTSENTAFPGVDSSCMQGVYVDEADGAVQDGSVNKGESAKASFERLAEADNEIEHTETSGSDSCSTRGKNPSEQIGNGENTRSSELPHKIINGQGQEDERAQSVNCVEKKRRRRKRSAMNDEQLSLIERAVQEEPDMQRNATSLQTWADRLSCHGSEVTFSQLKNWINNRKAKLARAAKDGQLLSQENVLGDKQDGSIIPTSSESTESLKGNLSASPANKDQNKVSPVKRIGLGTNMSQSVEIALPEISNRLDLQYDGPASNSTCASLASGQAVVLTDTTGKVIAKGTVFQVEGEWHGCNLADTRTCVVDITELKSDRIVRLPHPSIEAGATFEQAEIKVGNMRVLWDSGRMRTR